MDNKALYNSANGNPITLLYDPDKKFINDAATPCIAYPPALPCH